MSGFLRGWLRDLPLEECARFANACGAIVVSRHGCCPASPSWIELQHFLAHGSPHFRLREDPVMNRIHRATTRTGKWPEVQALAFDHRSQLLDMARDAGADAARIPALKGLILDAVQRTAADLGLQGAGILCDDRFGQDVLDRATGTGLWIARPVELPGSRPLAFEQGPDIGLALRAVPTGHVVKCLVHYHPDDPEPLRARQDGKLAQLYRACEACRLELLLEVIPPKDMPADAATLARALERIYAAGVHPDWWKLPPPDAEGWDAVEATIERFDPHCRGVLLLGLEAPPEQLKRSFDAAAGRRWCKGFAVGRSIFAAPAAAWLQGAIDDEAAVDAIAEAYAGIVRLWQARGGPG